MRQLDTFEAILWAAFAIWIIALVTSGPQLWHALRLLHMRRDRPAGFLLRGLMLIGGLGFVEVLILLVRIRVRAGGVPEWADEATLYSIPGTLALMALVFAYTGWRIQQR